MNDSNMYGHPRCLIDADYKRIGAHLIQPFDPARVQPASFDVTLGAELLVPKLTSSQAMAPLIGGLGRGHRIDLRVDKPGDHMSRVALEEGYTLTQHQAVLAATQEQVRCPNDMICSVEGKSTLARCFITCHVTAGFIDPGYCGAVTLEIVNHGPWDFVLYPGMAIAQLRFHWLGVTPDRPYGSPGLGSHYQGSTSVRPAETG